MPYDSTSKIITSPLNTSDIALATGEKSLDVGRLCSSSKVNPFTRYKPIDHANIGSVTDEERLQANHGLVIPQYTSPEYLIDEAAVWTYTPRTRYRMLDFTDPEDNTKGYYTGAPTNILTCPIRGDYTVNALNELAAEGRIPFYAFIKSTLTPNNINDRDIDESNGMGAKHSPARAANELAMCIDVEDLFTNAANKIINRNANQGLRFGLALFEPDSPNAYIKSLLCEVDLDPFGTPTDDPKAYQLSTDDAEGVFLAVPFARIYKDNGYLYIPLQRYPITDGSIYPCRFKLTTNGAGSYIVTYSFGTDPGTLNTSTRTTENTVNIYAFIRLNADFTHQTTLSTIANWVLKCDIAGTIYDSVSGNTVSIDRKYDDNKVATRLIEPTSFTIEPGEYAMLKFEVSMLWSADGVNRLFPSTQSASYLQLTPTLCYKGAPVGNVIAARQLFVTYGS